MYDDINFDYGKATSVSASCTAILDDHVWIFGGDALGDFNAERQVCDTYYHQQN